MNELNNNRKFKSETLLSVRLSVQIIMFVFSVVVFLSLITGGALFGVAGRAINAFILGVFGHSSYPLFVAGIYFTVKLFSSKNFIAKKKSVICVFILFLSSVLCYHLLTSSAILSSSASFSDYLEKCFLAGGRGIGGSTGGGIVFGLIVYPFKTLFEATGSYIIFSLIFAITVVVLFSNSQSREKHIEGIKEYPSNYFVENIEQTAPKKDFSLPVFPVNNEAANNFAPVNNFSNEEKTKKDDNIVTIPKKLFVGFIDDFVNIKTKKTRQSNNSYDILYSNKSKEKAINSDLKPEDIKANTLGGASYVDTFGDDFESKKKYILTPVDNLLRPSADYGLSERIFPINTGRNVEPANTQKPPRINHNMGKEPKTEQIKSFDENNAYQKYANDTDYGNISDSGKNGSQFKKSSVKPDYLDNLTNLMDKYNKTANEKSLFISDAPDRQYKNHEADFDNEIDLDLQGEASEEDFEQYIPHAEEENNDIIKINNTKQPEKTFKIIKDNPLKYQTEISVKQDKPIIKSPYIAPSVSLMNDILFDPNDVTENYEENVAILENTLNEFKVPAKVVSVTPGPTVTRYELQMPPGIPVSRLTSRANDIAMCLASNGEIRIEAPIPGKSLLGIELPNKKRLKVGLKEVIDSSEFISNKSPVAFALGKEITGKNIILDFAKMPHLLVAGSTGSGKSVCLNTLIISILYKASPEDVRLILIDPKRVEFNVYNGLPHLMLKDVITDAEQAISAFNWAINEMDRRFILFKDSVSKDISSYNEKMKHEGGQKIPRILIIVDELAELMMINKREIEEKIKKISQLSRAAGIHLILATQRPSVDIITGVIKANLSSRVTFKLMTQADSRTVLDCSGADKLLGEGDMIFLSNNMPKPIRLQGPYISMAEVEAIVEYIKKNNEAYYDEDVEQKILNPVTETEDYEEGEQSEEMDKYYVEALKLAVESGQISISMVQRRFAVGYSRAGKIIDEMEKQKFISAFEGSKPRQVLITKEEFERRFGTGS